MDGKLLVRHCALGDHYVSSEALGDYIDIDQWGNGVEEAWACLKCIQKVKSESKTLTEDRPPEGFIEWKDNSSALDG